MAGEKSSSHSSSSRSASSAIDDKQLLLFYQKKFEEQQRKDDKYKDKIDKHLKNLVTDRVCDFSTYFLLTLLLELCVIKS